MPGPGRQVGGPPPVPGQRQGAPYPAQPGRAPWPGGRPAPYPGQQAPNGPYPVPGPPWGGQQPPRRPSRRTAIIGGVAAAVVLLVVGLVVANGANTKYDKYFSNRTLRSYVRPFYGDITSCEPTSVTLATGATCTFRTGEEVDLIAMDDGVSMSQWRSALATAAGTDSVAQSRWRSGDLWTLVLSGSPALYWDVEDSKLAGLAVLKDGDSKDLRDWWDSTFGS